MLAFKVSKREHNTAVLKLKILEAFLDAMSDSLLHDIPVDEVCHRIGISKVTFFNYFKTKESVIDYFIQLWQYEMAYMISEKKLMGREALNYLFANVSHHKSANAIIFALMAYFIKTECYVPSAVTEYELYCYHREAYIKGYRHVKFYDIIRKAVLEIETDPQLQTEMIRNVMCGFYGIPFVMKIGFGSNLNDAYHQYLNTILREVNPNEK